MITSPGQPFTFSGVARYASARFGRLMGVAFLFALLSAAVIGRLAAHCWWPVITEGCGNLPEAGVITKGSLQLAEKDARLLAANQFLSLQLTLGDVTGQNAPVDLSLDLGRYEFTIQSILGENAFPYPDTWNIPLDRKVLWPLWGAWKGPLLLSFSAASLVILILTWFVLALLYAPLMLTLARMAGRPLSIYGAWKMAIASQWPASLLMAFAIGVYSTGETGLLFVIIMFVAHFIPSLLNVLIAPFFLPKTEDAAAESKTGRELTPKMNRKKTNPFSPRQASRKRKGNPFHSATAEEDE